MDESGKRFGKFGHVYVPRKGGNEEWNLLESASFSNIDLRWYNQLNEVHPDFEKYTGKTFSFGFKIHNSNRHGELEPFEGKLLSPINLGENEKVEVAKLEEVFEMDMDWAQRFNLIPPAGDEHSLFELVEKTQIGAMFVFAFPGRPLSKHKLVHYLGVLQLMDDIVDSKAPSSSSSSRAAPYSLVPRQLEILRQTLNGVSTNLSPSDLLVCSPLLFEPSSTSYLEQTRIMRGALALLQSCGKATVKVGTAQQVKVVFESVLRDLEADLLEKSNEWEAFRDAAEEDLYYAAKLKLGEATGGVEMLWEIVLAENGVSIDDSIRKTFLFKEYSRYFQLFGSKLNHLLSYQKEVTLEGGTHNEVSMMHVLHQLPLTEALQKVLDETNESVEMMLEARDLLLEMHPETEGFAEGINTAVNLALGSLMMCSYFKRYHPDLVYDCYVH